MIPRRNILRAIRKSIHQPKYAFQNIIKRAKAYWSYNFGHGKSNWPETISLFITYKCNLKCKMCGQWGDKGIFKSYDKNTLNHQLSLEAITKLIKDVKFFKPNITLFGGEPLINPEIIEIIKIIKDNDLRCNLITNGVLIKKYAQELIDSGLDEIIFSLDGPEEIHDSIRGIPGTYRKALEGFEELNKIKTAKNKKNPMININSTIFETNYLHFSETISVAQKFYPDNLTFHHLLFLDKTKVSKFQNYFDEKFGQNPFDWQGFTSDKVPTIDPQKIISQISEINSQKHTFNVSFYPNFNNIDIINWYSKFYFKSKSYKNRCMSLWMTAYIFPDGTIRPYHSMNYDIGNINQDSFLNIWNNKNYIKLRKYILKFKSFEVCAKGCTEFFRY